LRTYPPRRSGYPFAPAGERSVARGYAKVFARAESLIYIEDQYLWSREVSAVFAGALRAHPDLRIIAVVPHFPDQDGSVSKPPNVIGRQAALDTLLAAGRDRVAIYGLENDAGTPIYVHAKVCIVDDIWAAVGSDNVNRRSWTYDSELSVAVLEPAVLEPAALEPAALDPAGRERPAPAEGLNGYARRLRLTLACEHLGRTPDDAADLLHADSAFRTFARAAASLQNWYDKGCREARPPGRLRPAEAMTLDRRTSAWATPLYRLLYDPDGRPRSARRSGAF